MVQFLYHGGTVTVPAWKLFSQHWQRFCLILVFIFLGYILNTFSFHFWGIVMWVFSYIAPISSESVYLCARLKRGNSTGAQSLALVP